jgi:predicted Zn-dependent peptidase
MKTLQIVTTPTDSVVLAYMVHVGSIYEPAALRGISHVLEHMMFKTKKSKGTKKLLDDMANAGTFYNAMTSFDSTYYYTIGLKDVWKETVDMFHVLAMEPPMFTDEELAREIDVVIEELSLRGSSSDSPLVNLVWKGTEYESDIGGTPETVRSITKTDILALYNEYYSDSHMVVCLPEKIATEAKKYVLEKFGKHVIQTHCPRQRPYDLLKIKNDRDMGNIIASSKLQTTEVMLLFNSFPYDSKSIIHIDLLTSILSGMSGVLLKSLRRDTGFVYQVHVENNAFVDNGFYLIHFQSTHKSVATVVSTFLDTLAEFCRSLHTAKASFQKWKRAFILAERLRMQDPHNLVMRVLHDQFYSSTDAGSSLDGYLKHIDETLAFDEFVSVVRELFNCNGTKFVLATYDERPGTQTKVAKSLNDFLKTVRGLRPPTSQP